MAGVGAVVEHVGGLLLWTFLPPMIARFVLSQYYRIKYGPAPLQPKSGSYVYRRDYNRLFTVVVVLYFAYCIANYALHVKPSHYATMGVHREDIDARMKTHFRHAMVHMHPDKNPDADPTAFMRMKQVYELLSNFDSRVAYDCYGPEVISNVQMSSTTSASTISVQDFFTQAAMEFLAFYAMTAVVFLMTSWRSSWSRLFWRAIALLSCASVDMYVLMRPERFGATTPHPSTFLQPLVRLWNGVPTFVKLALLRQIYMYGSTAAGQVASLFDKPAETEQVSERIRYMEQIIRGPLTKETAFILAQAMGPVQGNAEIREHLQNQMGKLAAELQLFDMLDSGDRERLNALRQK